MTYKLKPLGSYNLDLLLIYIVPPDSASSDMITPVKRPGGVRLKERYLRPINGAFKSRTRNAIPGFFVDIAILNLENYQNHYSKITTNVLLA
jgi:hypothetical protein